MSNRSDATTSAASPYGRSRSADSERTDHRRQNVRNAISSFRDRRSSNQSRPGFQRSPSAAPFYRGASSNEPGVSVSTVPPVHQRRPWLPTGAFAAVNQIVAKSDEALKSPTDASSMARTLREVKARAASCLHTYLCEPSSGQSAVTFADETKVYAAADSAPFAGTPAELHRLSAEVPAEVHTLESEAEKAAFAEAHKRLCLVGYDKVSNEEQDEILEHLLDEVLMVEDSPVSASDDGNFSTDGRRLKNELVETTNASGIDMQALTTETITANLVITLLHSGLSVKQICAIFDTGASKPFAKTVRECIRGILVALPKSAQVTTATSNASAASISLRRYNFAITREMIDTVARIGIGLSRYDVITVLPAPLVCSGFQHDFGIVSSPVFKGLGVIIKQGRGPLVARIISASVTRPTSKLRWDIAVMVFRYCTLSLTRLLRIIVFAGRSITH